MHLRTILFAAAAALACAGAAQADTVTYNTAPEDTWNNYGAGNDYAPANTIVLTTDAGDQIYLRAHETFQQAPASTGDTYNLALGLSHLSFDWGIDTTGSGGFDGVTALLTLSKLGGLGSGDVSFNPLLTPDNKPPLNGSVQNSFRSEWFLPFDPNENATYRVNLAVQGLDGGEKSLVAYAKIGSGAVPEPASWALMIAGFGGAGAMLRRRRGATSFA